TLPDAAVVLDSFAHGVAVFDTGNLTPRLKHANTELIRMTGYSLEELRAKPLWALLAGPDSDQQVQQQVRNAFSGSPVPALQWLVDRKDQTAFWARITARGARGGPTFLVALEDVSE